MANNKYFPVKKEMELEKESMLVGLMAIANAGLSVYEFGRAMERLQYKMHPPKNAYMPILVPVDRQIINRVVERMMRKR